ncbi:hypothetical protein L1987_28891 [Smallanthus sonchifolius]|uniref:Uncharacterized protein n=1 Tax=Smallanthus sonchifolius TaxID=185202 RepID=A0ACB9I0A0_9ASTR|nr:hypothetical protein L1987_28891 [Smallanthus sonchifolius]
MHLQLGQVSTVVISSPRLAREILKIQDINFADRPTTTTSQIFFYKGSSIGWAPYGNYLKQIKKLATSELLSAKKVRSFSFIREDELSRVFKFVESSSGAPINFRDMARQIVNNIVSRATLGDACQVREFIIDSTYAMLKSFNSFNLFNYYPSLNFLNVISGKKAQWLKMHKEVDVILDKILEEHRSRQRNKQYLEDLVDILLRVKDGGDFDLPIMTNDRIKAIILEDKEEGWKELLTAGTSSSSMTIEWAFCEMMRNPEIMKKAQLEVRGPVKGNTITEADIQTLDYIKLIVKETMRLHCVPILLPRIPDSWENPNSFIPERFEKSSIGYSGDDFEFLPFGAGRRMCPGMNFGLGTVEYVIANLLHRFDWKLPEGVKPHDLDMREFTAISTVPIQPLRIVPISKSKPN